MPAPPNVIHVPDPPREAFNTERPVGKLLRSQMLHLREALINQVEDLIAIITIDPASIKTEGEASAYIEKSTALLHPHAPKGARK